MQHLPGTPTTMLNHVYRFAKPRLLFVVLGVFVLAVILATHISVCDYRVCPPAPWSRQLTIAQRAMRWYWGDFTLTKVIAQPVSQPWYTTPTVLDVAFHYVTPNGTARTVHLEDTRPRTTVRVGDVYHTSATETLDFQNDVPLIQITAAQALQAVAQELRVFEQGGQRQSLPIIALDAGVEIEKKYATPVIWRVIGYRWNDHELETIVITVDARTGAVLTRE